MNIFDYAEGAAASTREGRQGGHTRTGKICVTGSGPDAGCAHRNQGGVCEAASAAEIKTPEPPVGSVGSCDASRQQWTTVTRHRRIRPTPEDDEEAHTTIVWGVPHDVSANAVLEALVQPEHRREGLYTCRWRGTGHGRHVAIVFGRPQAAAAWLLEGKVSMAMRTAAAAFNWRVQRGRT